MFRHRVAQPLSTATEDDRDDGEPSPADRQAGDHVGEPMDAQQGPTGGDRNSDQGSDSGERCPHQPWSVRVQEPKRCPSNKRPRPSCGRRGTSSRERRARRSTDGRSRLLVPLRPHDGRGRLLDGHRFRSGRGQTTAVRASLAAVAGLIAVSVAAGRGLLGVHWLTNVITSLAIGWAGPPSSRSSFSELGPPMLAHPQGASTTATKLPQRATGWWCKPQQSRPGAVANPRDIGP